MKTYDDLAGDGGSNIVDQVQALGVKLRSRLDRIKHKVALMSGKGGVGKSSLTANVAACLVDKGYSVGILDADLNGPSICHLLGVRNSQKLIIDENGVQPGTGIHGIKLMSMDMLLSSPDSPVMWTEETDATAVWVSTMESTALRELVADTDWGDLDYLLIDMPPGSDRIDNIRGLIPELAGVVEITIPSMLSQHIVAKSITKNNKMKVPILGLVENMAGYTCPHCEKEGPLFEGQDVEELAKQKNIPYIGKIPFDTRIGRKTDSGSLFYMENKDSVTGKAIGSAVDKILDSI
ncbi:MAG TPA: P-loop NTPase [Nitrospinaceae bacterium]|jgi:ATP-binding protein involved in chromosome partitioning|nr:P-loop NTPase [Nitrospinaceae bacterium]|tara:strand:- start:593 stop:1471 length:879 start_codon:yes stop_codon:yes gene_type:complete